MHETPMTGTMRNTQALKMGDAASDSMAQSLTKYSKNPDNVSDFQRPNFVGRDLSNNRRRKDHKKF